MGLLLSAPAVLNAGTGLDTSSIGYLSLGGILGVVCVLLAGWNSDRTRDRLRGPVMCAALYTGGLLLTGLTSTPSLIIAGYLLFAATYFAGGCLVLTLWADVLPVRELAVEQRLRYIFCSGKLSMQQPEHARILPAKVQLLNFLG